MKTIYFSLLLLLSILSTTYSQSVSDYVKTTEGEIFKGQIDVKYKRHQMTELTIRKEGAAKTFSFDKVKEYSENKVLYTKEIVEVSDRVHNALTVKANSSFSLRKDTAFVRLVFKSEKSLFAYRDRNDNTHFFLGNSENLEYLIYDKYIIEKDGKEVWAENKKFVGQLMIAFGDCQNLTSKISRTLYTETSLLDLFSEYAKCKNETVVVQSTKSRNAYILGAQAHITTLIDSYDPEIYDRVNYVSGFVSPNIGIIHFGRNKRKHSFVRLEASYAYNKGKLTIESGTRSARVISDRVYTVHNIQIQGTTGISFGKGVVKPFIAGGLGYYYSIKQNMYINSKKYSNGILESSYEDSRAIVYNKAKLSLPMGLGLIGKTWSTEFRFDGYSVLPKEIKARRLSCIVNILF